MKYSAAAASERSVFKVIQGNTLAEYLKPIGSGRVVVFNTETRLPQLIIFFLMPCLDSRSIELHLAANPLTCNARSDLSDTSSVLPSSKISFEAEYCLERNRLSTLSFVAYKAKPDANSPCVV